MGYDRIGIWDSPALFREPWTTLASVAAGHERGSGSAPGSRTRSRATRSSARRPRRRSTTWRPGRVYIGIGAGGTGVWHLGLSTARLAELEAYVLAVRGLLERGSADWHGTPLTLPWAGPRRIPIIMSAPTARGRSPRRASRRRRRDRPRHHAGRRRRVARALETGAREGGRSLEDLEVWFTSLLVGRRGAGAAKADGAWSATAFALHFARLGRGEQVRPRGAAGAVARDRAAPTTCSSHGHPSAEQKAGLRRARRPARRRRVPARAVHVRGHSRRGGGAAAGARCGRERELRRCDRRRPARARAADHATGRGSSCRGSRGEERMIDLLITGGHVVTPFEEGELDVGIDRREDRLRRQPGAVDAEAAPLIDATRQARVPRRRRAARAHPRADAQGLVAGAGGGCSRPRARPVRHSSAARRRSSRSRSWTSTSSDQELDGNLAVEHRRRDLRRPLVRRLRIPPRLDRHARRTRPGPIAEAVADGTATFKFFTTDLTTTQAGDPARQRLGARRCSRSARGSARWRWCTPRTTI